MAAKGPQGNKDQLLIALELSKGFSTKEVSEKLGKPLITVQKLNKKLTDGWKPDLSEAAIAAAPPSPGKMVPGGGKPSVSSGDTTTKKTTKKEKEEEEKKDTHPASGYIGFAALQLRCQYTPIMYMARLAAEKKWGWSGNIPFEDFVDTVFYHFFKDRGIVLQGYIVEDEVNGGGDAKIKELQTQINELKELVKINKGG